MSDKSAAIRLLNASGYAFQLAVESVVANCAYADVVVASREHPWRHEHLQKSGFIDLIVEKGMTRLVVECKRTTNAQWLFLVPDPTDVDVGEFHCLWSMYFEPNVPAWDWGRELLSPKSATSQFCCVRGSGEGQVAAIDRIGAELVYATEALAHEERNRISEEMAAPFPMRYIPVIVTNADLAIARFDPRNVDVTSGRLEDCEVIPVDMVRYRKALDPVFVGSRREAKSTRESNRLSQRSLVVVSASSLPVLLEKLGTVQDGGRQAPWRAAFEQHRARR